MTSSATSRCDVLVVGLGPAGACLANLLARRGVDVVAVERSTAPVGEPRAVHLDAETMRLLNLTGITAAELEEMTVVSHGMEYVDPEGRAVFTFEPFERPPVLGWSQDRMFHQPDLDRRLRSALADSPHATVILGRSVLDVQADGDLQRVRLDDGSTIEASWVVGCDGASSTMRGLVGVSLEDLGYDRRWVVIDLLVRDGVVLPQLVEQLCDPARIGTFAPGVGQRCRMEFALEDDETPEEMTRPETVWSLVSRWISASDAEIERVAIYRFHALIPDTFSSGRSLLAGDAAHQMPPFMGQGACAGIRDAANLAWKLAAVLTSGADVSLLDTYEAERRPHVQEVIELSVLSGRTIETIANAIRDGRTPEYPPPASPTSWSRLPRLRGGLVPEGAEAPVGDQGAQVRVDVDGTAVPLDQLGGFRFVVLTRAPLAGAVDDDQLAYLALADYPGGLDHADLVLGPHYAVIWRPDRYVYAVADDEGTLRGLVAEVRALVTGTAP